MSLSHGNVTKNLNLLGFLPMSGQGWTGGGACLPAALMAVRHVNERPGLLDDYNVTYTWVDTQVRCILVCEQYYVVVVCNFFRKQSICFF